MLTFICPHCQHELKIIARHLGLRGTCNRCGGRIALIGRADAQRPQMASQIGETPEGTARPGLQRALVSAKMQMEPPTERQLDYLRRLGLPKAQLEKVGNKAEASRLIEEWLPPPSQSQRDYLARLGATDDEIAALRTKAQAADLIQRFLSGT